MVHLATGRQAGPAPPGEAKPHVMVGGHPRTHAHLVEIYNILIIMNCTIFIGPFLKLRICFNATVLMINPNMPHKTYLISLFHIVKPLLQEMLVDSKANYIRLDEDTISYLL